MFSFLCHRSRRAQFFQSRRGSRGGWKENCRVSISWFLPKHLLRLQQELRIAPVRSDVSAEAFSLRGRANIPGISTNRLMDVERRQGGGRPSSRAPRRRHVCVHAPKVPFATCHRKARCCFFFTPPKQHSSPCFPVTFHLIGSSTNQRPRSQGPELAALSRPALTTQARSGGMLGGRVYGLIDIKIICIHASFALTGSSDPRSKRGIPYFHYRKYKDGYLKQIRGDNGLRMSDVKLAFSLKLTYSKTPKTRKTQTLFLAEGISMKGRRAKTGGGRSYSGESS